MKVEFFSAGCRLCEQTLDMLEHTFPHVEVVVHRARSAATAVVVPWRRNMGSEPSLPSLSTGKWFSWDFRMNTMPRR